MCDRGYYEWLRVSRYYLRRVADQDRWEAEAEAHGNEGSVPWNRLNDLCRLAIREVFEIFTYTDPAGTGEAGPQGLNLGALARGHTAAAALK